MLTFKTSPEDFQVEERFEFTPAAGGEFSVYRLTKKDITTWRALREILEAFKLTSDRASVAGLKDKVAVAVQHLSLRGGPPQNLSGPQFELVYLGAGARPVESRDSRGNRFTAVMRDAAPETAAGVAGLLEEAARNGLPSYFDSQRFGSLRGGGDFPVRRLVKGDVLGALHCVLCTSSRYDPPARRRQRDQVREHWGDWPACLSGADSMERRVLEALVRSPEDPMHAYRKIPHKLRLMFLHAYQSFLWNEILATAFRRAFPAETRLDLHYLGGLLAMPRRPTAETRAWLAALDLPLPAPGVELRPTWKESAEAVLAKEGIGFEDLRLKDERDGFFRPLARSALLVPEEAKVLDPPPAPDAVRVQFALPPGTYATLVLKWMSAAAG